MPPIIMLIKNMVCLRCMLTVENIFRNESIDYQAISLGEVRLEQVSPEQKARLSKSLENVGFELIDNRGSALIEKIKQLIIKRARNDANEEDSKTKLSNYLSANVNHEYSYLSSLFSSVEGRTIENYFIEQRIEKAKELLVYGQMTLSQIAFDLEYSSTAHLSAQFKKVTGLTPSFFKELRTVKRRFLDNV
ncbi:MAG: AraC family transcriptional regulator [Ferruginibacter sp.]